MEMLNLRGFILMFLVLNSVFVRAQIDSTGFLFSENNSNIATNKYFKTTKSTSFGERVVSKVVYGYNNSGLEMIDSSVFEWSGEKGSSQNGAIVTIENFDLANGWKYASSGILNYTRVLKKFNADNQITSELLQKWDSSSSTWRDHSKFEYDYLGPNRTYSINKYYDTSNKSWLDLEQIFSVYIGSNLIERSKQSWDNYNKRWLNRVKWLNKYSGTNLVEHIVQECRSIDNIWVNLSKYNVSYFGDKPIASEEKQWDPKTSSWMDAYRGYSEISITGDTIVYTSQTWNSYIGKWQDQFRSHYVYADGYLIAHTTSRNLSDVWYWGSKKINSYTDSKLNNTITFSWDDSLGEWITHSRKVYKYNENENLISETNQIWDVSTGWIDDTVSSRYIYYYYESYPPILGPKAAISKKLLVYPNPAFGSIVYADYFTENSELATVEITNSQGIKVFQFSDTPYIGDHSVRIPTGNLASGFYLINLYSNGRIIQSSKFSK